MSEFGLTSRQYNAVYTVLRGMVRAIDQSRPRQIADLEQRILSTQRRRDRATRSSDRFSRHNLSRRIERLEHRLRTMREDQENGRARICFGSSKLFRIQRALAQNNYDSHEHWLTDWRAARSGSFFVLGSKDESAGCQGCVAIDLGGGLFQLNLRLPRALDKSHISLTVRFRYGWPQLAWALKSGQAISYRFFRDAKGWRVFATTAAAPIALSSDFRLGALGVDLNADHVALCSTDRHGNLIAAERLPLVTYGIAAEGAKARLGDAVKEIVARAISRQVPIVLERLDFSKKKAALRERGPRYVRMLSSFAYKRFARILCGRAHDAGVEVKLVEPAYSTLIGKHKFARRYGRSEHQCAALVLARRAQGFSERPGRRLRVALDVPVRTRARHVWSFWAAVARRERAGAAPRRRSRFRDPDATAAAINAVASATLPSSAGGIPAREFVGSAVWPASLTSTEAQRLQERFEPSTSQHTPTCRRLAPK